MKNVFVRFSSFASSRTALGLLGAGTIGFAAVQVALAFHIYENGTYCAITNDSGTVVHSRTCSSGELARCWIDYDADGNPLFRSKCEAGGGGNPD